MGGRLRSPGVQTLLQRLTAIGNAGLCLLTTRMEIKDILDSERRSGINQGEALQFHLSNLTPAAGAALLHSAGANRVGAASVNPDDPELLQPAEKSMVMRSRSTVRTLFGARSSRRRAPP